MRACLPLVFLLACPAGPSTDPLPDEVELGGECDAAEHFGRFVVQAQADYTIVQGQVSDGVVPASIPSETAREGSCRLLLRQTPFCDPGCDSASTCDFDGRCIPYPETQDLGLVDVRGLVEDFVMEPVQPGWNYFNTSLPLDAMRVGEPIRLTTGEGRWSSFELFGLGLERLDSGVDELAIQEGQPLQLSWQAADTPSEVELRLNIDQHGTSPSTLHCLFDDDGDGAVPAAMIDALLGAGVTGWPAATLARRTADRAEVGGGCVDFVVSTPLDLDVDVAGFIPCDPAHPCPVPLDCNLEIELCE